MSLRVEIRTSRLLHSILSILLKLSTVGLESSKSTTQLQTTVTLPRKFMLSRLSRSMMLRMALGLWKVKMCISSKQRTLGQAQLKFIACPADPPILPWIFSNRAASVLAKPAMVSSPSTKATSTLSRRRTRIQASLSCIWQATRKALPKLNTTPRAHFNAEMRRMAISRFVAEICTSSKGHQEWQGRTVHCRRREGLQEP